MSVSRAIIDTESIAILKSLLGEKMYVIYGPSFEIEDEVIASPSFSIRTRNHWLNLTSTWLSTNFDVSYYQLAVALSDHPLGITYDQNERTLRHPVSSFLFNRGKEANEIEKIEIYTKYETWNSETVEYDYAVLISAMNGFRLCIRVREDISDQIECTVAVNVIEEMLVNCKLREKVE